MPLVIPRYPVLNWTGPDPPGRRDMGCLLDLEHIAYTTSGRMAIALALEHIGVGPEHEVLLPAYHCPTMVHPVHWMGATARFYPLQPDLSVDLVGLRRMFNQRTRVVIAAHFFGFPADLRALRELCDDAGLQIIEDCAHTLYGGTRDQPVGSIGDYAISSLMKFFPVVDGGCLASRRHRVEELTQQSGGAGFEARALVNALEFAVSFGRLRGLGIPVRAFAGLKDALRSAPNTASQATITAGANQPRQQCATDFDPTRIHTRMSLFSRLVKGCTSHAHNIARRRQNYGRLHEALSVLPDCHVFAPSLSAHMAPYVLPLWLDRPDPAFQAMQAAGLPVMRWDELFNSAGDPRCAISDGCARHLIQVPCHQGLTDHDVEHLICEIRRTLTTAVAS